MKNQYKTWIIGVLFASLVIPLAIGLVNYYIDPLWCFDVSNKYNQYQLDINERVQKTNYITYRKQTYQGILIGSSRSAYISPKVFKGISVFNYAINELTIDEYPVYLNYAKKVNGSDFKYIFLGLDFAQAIKHHLVMIKSLDPEYIISEAQSPFNRIKILISVDTLKYSMQNYYRSKIGDKYFYYTRDNVKIFRKLNPDEVKSFFSMFLMKYNQYYNNFAYSEKYKEVLRRIKKDHPTSTIIVFTTPDSEPLIKIFIKAGILADYFRWLSDIIDVYGGCYNFMYPSAVTKNYNEYFTDAVHTYPATGDLMVDFMFNNKPNNLGFGMYLDKENFKQKKAVLEELYKKI